MANELGIRKILAAPSIREGIWRQQQERCHLTGLLIENPDLAYLVEASNRRMMVLHLFTAAVLDSDLRVELSKSMNGRVIWFSGALGIHNHGYSPLAPYAKFLTGWCLAVRGQLPEVDVWGLGSLRAEHGSKEASEKHLFPVPVPQGWAEQWAEDAKRKWPPFPERNPQAMAKELFRNWKFSVDPLRVLFTHLPPDSLVRPRDA